MRFVALADVLAPKCWHRWMRLGKTRARNVARSFLVKPFGRYVPGSGENFPLIFRVEGGEMGAKCV